jgi:hypothetical protein
MAAQILSRDIGAAGSPCVCQARIVAPDATGAGVTNEGNAVQAADVSTISCTVYDVTPPTPATISASPTITTAAITALTADNQWSRFGVPIDSTGRNFLFTVPGTAFPIGNRTYWAVFKIVLTGATGSTLWLTFEHHTTPTGPL